MVIKLLVHGVLCSALVVLCSGCVHGLLYTSITEPLSVDMNKTPRGITKGADHTHLISIPIVPVSLAATWDSRAIGDAAKRAGLTEIYYADMHTFSVLLGIWEQKSVQVYGR